MFKSIKINLINNEYYEATINIDGQYLNVLTSNTLSGILNEIKKKEDKLLEKCKY